MSTQMSELEAITKRLEKLETKHRRLKGCALLFFMGVGVALLSAAEDRKEKTTDVEKLVLRDGEGRMRAWLGVEKEGPGLHLLGADGGDQADVCLTKDGLVLRLNDRGGKVQTGVNLNKKGVVLVSYSAGNQAEAGPNAILETTGPFTR